MFATARSTAAFASGSTGPPIRRLPLTEAVNILRNGEASILLSSDVKSLRIRYVAQESYQGTMDFVRQFAPQLAYANPALPMTVERIPDPRNPSRKPGAGQIAHWPGGAVPPTEVTVDFHTRSSETRRHTDSDALTILRELLKVSGTKHPSIEGAAHPLIAAPSGRRRAATEEGTENSAGVTQDASAESESAAAESASEELAKEPASKMQRPQEDDGAPLRTA